MKSKQLYCYSCKNSTIHNSKVLPNADAGSSLEQVWVCSVCARCLNKDGGDDYCQQLLAAGENDD